MAVDITADVTLAAVTVVSTDAVTEANVTVQSVDASVTLSSVITSIEDTINISVQGVDARVTLAPILTSAFDIESTPVGDGVFRPTSREAIMGFEEALIYGESDTSLTGDQRRRGAKVTFITDTDRFFDMGTRLVVGANPNPHLNFFCGPVLKYTPSTGELTMAVTIRFGTDTIDSWVIYQGAPPATGDPLADPIAMHANLGGL